MKCQSLLSWENKIILECCLLKNLHGMLSIKDFFLHHIYFLTAYSNLCFPAARTTFTVEKTASHYVVSDLRRDGRYKLWINAVSEGGVSPRSELLFGVVVDRSRFSLHKLPHLPKIELILDISNYENLVLLFYTSHFSF